MTQRNWHSIVGPNGMCECGVKADGTVVHCGELLKAESPAPVDPRGGSMTYRSACSLCDSVLSAASEDALDKDHLDHLTSHLEEHCEAEVEAGRAERVTRDGKTLYRFLDDDAPTL